MTQKLFLFLLLISTLKLYSSEFNSYSYYEAQYKDLQKEDQKALSLVKKSIQAAKSKSDYIHLSYAYEDAVHFSKNENQKISFAHKFLAAARVTGRHELISRAYLLQGTLQNDYKQQPLRSLKYYLLAHQSAEKTADKYLLNKVKFHLAKLKGQLGHYDQSLELFDETERYFTRLLEETSSNEQVVNARIGLSNTYYQKALCFLALGEFVFAREAIENGEKLMSKFSAYSQGKISWNYTKGLLALKTGSPKESIQYFKLSILEAKQNRVDQLLIKNHFYLAETSMALGMENEAVKNYRVIDSLYNIKPILLAEVKATFEALAKYGDKDMELYYLKKENDLERILASNEVSMNSTMFRKYDKVVKQRAQLGLFSGVFSLTPIALFVFLCLQNLDEVRQYVAFIPLQRDEAKERILVSGDVYLKAAENGVLTVKEKEIKYNENTTKEILSKLEDFKKRKGFLKKGITIEKLAKKMGTNRTRLSFVLNSVVGCGFTDYINRLRIEYIIEKIQSESKYLLYTIEALGDEAGFASRQSFSDQFKNIAGIRPSDFIKSIKCTGNP